MENVLNVEYSIWRTEILRDEGLKFCEKLSTNRKRIKEKADNAAFRFAIFSGCVGTRMAKFLLSLWRDQIYACSNINIMYELDSTQQKFDV